MNRAHHVLEQSLADSDALTAAMNRYADTCERHAQLADALTAEVEAMSQLLLVARLQQAEACKKQMAAMGEQCEALRALILLSSTLAQQAAAYAAPPSTLLALEN